MAVGYQCGVDRTGGIYPAVRWRDIETLRFCPHPKACSDHQDSRWRRGAESPERDETDLSIRLAMGYRISQALWPCEAGSIPATRSSGSANPWTCSSRARRANPVSPILTAASSALRASDDSVAAASVVFLGVTEVRRSWKKFCSLSFFVMSCITRKR